MERKPTPEILGHISQEEHEALLARDESDPTLQALRERLGEVAGTAVGILVSEGEEGPEASYIILGGEDAGVRIRRGTHDRHGLPDPSDMSYHLSIDERIKTEQTEQLAGLDEVKKLLISRLDMQDANLGYMQGVLERDRQLGEVIDTLATEWMHTRYGGGMPDSSALAAMLKRVHSIRARLQTEQAPLAEKATQLSMSAGGVEELMSTEKLQAADRVDYERERIAKAISTAGYALNEATHNFQSSVNAGDEMIHTLGAIADRLETLLREPGGYLIEVSAITQRIDELVSSKDLSRYRYLDGAYEALKDVAGLHEKLTTNTW